MWLGLAVWCGVLGVAAGATMGRPLRQQIVVLAIAVPMAVALGAVANVAIGHPLIPQIISMAAGGLVGGAAACVTNMVWRRRHPTP